MPKVFVINKSSHDYSDAKKYGELVFLSEGKVNRYATTMMVREFAPKLKHSNPEDYILITGLSVMSCVACSMFSMKHKRLNLLLFRSLVDPEDTTSDYVERVMDWREIKL